MRRAGWFLFFCWAAVGQDLTLSYHSAIDDTEQPYRVYVPRSYSAERPIPVVFVLHGTGGDHNSFFQDKTYTDARVEEVAERRGVLIVSPMARSVTEFRGVGENDCFCVLNEVRKRWKVDEDRIYLTGLSMGGTGAAYLGLHHPDLFAAVAPLSAAWSFPWLARNAQALPFLWIGGALDSVFYHRGVSVGVDRMRQYGAPVLLEVLPDEGHPGPMKHFDRVVTWLLKHKREAHPRKYYFEADTPLHGRAWWTTMTRFTDPGKMAWVEAEAVDRHTARVRTENVLGLEFHPDSAVFDLSAPVTVEVNGKAWEPRRYEAARAADLCAEWRTHPVAKAPETLEMLGTEKPLANWIADAMRGSTGADLALWNGYAYRGLPVFRGTVDIVDLVQASRPFDQNLVTVELTGREIARILDDNVPDPEKNRPSKIDSPGASLLVQVSGMTYVFDRTQPPGKRIVSTSLDPDRVYRVAMEGQVVERDSIRLAGRFLKLDYRVTEVPFTTALYGWAARNPVMAAGREGRVREVGASGR